MRQLQVIEVTYTATEHKLRIMREICFRKFNWHQLILWVFTNRKEITGPNHFSI